MIWHRGDNIWQRGEIIRQRRDNIPRDRKRSGKVGRFFVLGGTISRKERRAFWVVGRIFREKGGK
jgi:hypothetical protein